MGPLYTKAVPFEDRRRVYRYIMSMRGVRRRLALALSSAVLITVVAFFSLLPYIPRYLLFALWYISIWVVASYLWQWALKPFVATALSAHGYVCCNCGYLFRSQCDHITCCPACGAEREAMVCYACGYSLRGLGPNVTCCPECGQPRVVPEPALKSWLAFQYLDRRLKLDRKGRWRVRSLAVSYASRRLVWSITMVIAATGLILLGLYSWYPQLVDLDHFHPFVWPLVIFGPWIATAWAGRWVYAPSLRRAARTLGHNVCLKCAYWMGGLAKRVDRCPECGWRRETAS